MKQKKKKEAATVHQKSSEKLYFEDGFSVGSYSSNRHNFQR